jgi:hypothetical protein
MLHVRCLSWFQDDFANLYERRQFRTLIIIVLAFRLFLDPAHLDQEIVLDNKGNFFFKKVLFFVMFFLLADTGYFITKQDILFL